MTSFILDNIQLRNVRCYGDEVMSMDFPLNNLTVFTGHVGAGKSTILKAVSMALYGEDGGAKGEKLSIDDMINEKNKKNLEIHLLFHSINDIDNSEHKYEIHLFHKHTKYNNKLVFVKDGKDISLESKTATYELIEKTLIPKNVYHNIYYFTQQAKNFFTALPNSEQKEIFNSILDLSEYSQYYENAKNESSQVEEKIRIKENEIKSMEENIKSIENLKTNACNDLYNQKKLIQDKIQSLNEKIENTQNTLDNIQDVKQEDIDNINEQITTIKNNCLSDKQKLDEDYKNMCQEVIDTNKIFTNTKVPALKDKYIKLKLEKTKEIDDKINNCKLEITKCESEILNIKNKLQLDLSNFKSKIEKEYSDSLKKLNNKIVENNNNLSSKKIEIVQTLTKLKDDVQSKVDDLKSSKKTSEDYVVQYKAKIENLENTNSDNLNNIKKYEDDLNKPDAVCSLCGQKLVSKDHVQKHIDTIKKSMQDIATEIVKYQVCIKMSNEEIEKIDNQIKELVDKFNNQKKDIESEYQSYSQQVSVENKKYETEIEILEDKHIKEISDIEEKYIYNEDNDWEVNLIKYNNELLNYQKSINTIVDELRDLYKKDYSDLNNEKDIQIQKIKDGYNETAKVTKEVNNKRLKELQDLDIKKNDLTTAIDNRNCIESTLKDYKNELKNLNDKTLFDNRKKQIEDFDKVITDAKDKCIQSNTQYKLLNKQKNILDFWKGAFSDSGIKSMLIDSAIPHMNECVSQELERVAPGVFTVSFDTLSETKSGKIKDKFNINIVNNLKGSTGHKKLSGGEKRIIDLCCMSALRSLAEKLYNKKFCHIFYDEILDSLDDECKQLFCANIKMQSSDGCNVTLVTHDLPEDVDPDRTFPF